MVSGGVVLESGKQELWILGAFAEANGWEKIRNENGKD